MLDVKEIIQNQARRVGYEFRRVKPVEDIALYKTIYGEESVRNKRFYNVSAGGHLGYGGGFFHPCWTNVDLGSPEETISGFRDGDIFHDLLSMKELPIESRSAELVHSRFSIEHITDSAAQVMFDEVYRILKKGGFFRVVVPNIDLDYRAYLSRDLSHFSWVDTFSRDKNYKAYGLLGPLRDTSIEQIFLIHFASNSSSYHIEGPEDRIDDEEFRNLFKNLKYEEALDYCSKKCLINVARKYRQNHINWWNQQKLEKFLVRAGFKSVYTVAPNQSTTPVFRNKGYFDNVWQMVALTVEAEK